MLMTKMFRPKINRLTGVINCKIPELYDYLFEAYGNISDLTLADKRQATINHQYVHEDSITNTFEVIQEYADMAEAHGTPESDEQLKSITMIILMRANIFAESITEWNKKKDTEDKSWTKFQEHFIIAQKDYKRSHLTETSASLGFTPPAAQANAVTQDSPPSNEALALSAAQDYIAALEEKILLANQANQVVSAPPPSTTTTDNPLVRELMNQITELTAQISKGTPGTSGRSNQKKKAGPRKYCLTHGWCAHSSNECNKPKEGHQKDATATDMKGGNSFRCPWIKDSQHSA